MNEPFKYLYSFIHEYLLRTIYGKITCMKYSFHYTNISIKLIAGIYNTQPTQCKQLTKLVLSRFNLIKQAYSIYYFRYEI